MTPAAVLGVAQQQVFISFAGADAFEADLLQFAVETLLRDFGVAAWTFQRDQAGTERQVAASLKRQVRQSVAMIFLVSPTTLDSGATQRIELAYADAFDVPILVLMNNVSHAELRRREHVPPLLLAGHGWPATDWRRTVDAIETMLRRAADV